MLTFYRRHFTKLHRVVSIHSGILVCTRDHEVANLALRIHQVISGCSSLENQ